jgi:integrase/recombinase XerD
MELLQAGVDRSLIAIWLGHESLDTTQIYLDANLALKEEILAKTRPLKRQTRPVPTRRSLLAFLKALRAEPFLCRIRECLIRGDSTLRAA